jgi:hypothetical protein
MSDAPKIEVDDSWKQQAEAEKATLGGGAAPAAATPPNRPEAPAAAETKPDAPAGKPRSRGVPPASFELLVQQHVTQILMALGAMPHPVTKALDKDLEVAKHYVDMLGVLQEKTKGNLSEPEQKLLDSALYEMRMSYVAAVRAGK